jgi:MtrB/PioB family decaheme-associated outer membrane protein
MSSRLVTAAGVLLLSAQVALAQTPATPQPQAPAGAAPSGPSLGSIDFGFRGTNADTDEARYERYQDLRNGVASLFQIGKETGSYVMGARAYNVGYRDQRYKLDYDRSKLKFGFLWDSIPTNFSYLTVSPWTVDDDNGVLTISPALRQQVQNRTAVGVPCAPGAPPAACGNPTQAAQALANRSIYNQNLAGFDIQARRDIAAVALNYAATPSLDVNVDVSSTGKTGHQPWGASFAFNNANEVPLPLDNRTNDVSAGVEWSHAKGMARLAWNGSFFDNNVSTLTWDNPIRATDFDNGLQPPNGPYDPSAYSNGNGPARGRMALPPSNHMNVVSAMGLYKMPAHTTVNGTLQFTDQRQNEALIPWTINPLIAQPSVYAVFPHLAALPRSTADAEAKGVNALINLNSRPFRRIAFNVRYRYNDRDNQTPTFDATEYVRFDAVPEEIEEGLSQQFDTTRKTFDATATFNLYRFGAVRAGYGHDGWERQGRGFSDVGDNIFRVSYDAFTNQYFTIRAAYEGSRRRGDGFIESGIDYEGVGGTQPSLRYYDEADRNRHRTSLTFTMMPKDIVDVNVTFTAGRDSYPQDEFTPGRDQFGLLDNDTTAFAVGVDVLPRPQLALGATYEYETYSALQRSRNAAPQPSPEWFDPTRDWTMDNDENVNTLTLYADLLKAIKRTDIHVAYDFMDSDNAYVHGGPRIQQLETNTSVTGTSCPTGVSDCFIPLPKVTTNWNRFTADVKYFFRADIGIGFVYRYEKLNVTDFATIDANGSVGFTAETGTVRTDYLGGLITGYNPRNYKGQTAFIRLLYLF